MFKGPIPKTLAVVVVVLVILLMTKIANDPRTGQEQNRSFWLEGQKVLQCTPTEITFVDRRYAQTHLQKDGSWPTCSTFESGQPMDFFLARGELTHYIRSQKSAWWH